VPAAGAPTVTVSVTVSLNLDASLLQNETFTAALRTAVTSALETASGATVTSLTLSAGSIIVRAKLAFVTMARADAFETALEASPAAVFGPENGWTGVIAGVPVTVASVSVDVSRPKKADKSVQIGVGVGVGVGVPFLLLILALAYVFSKRGRGKVAVDTEKGVKADANKAAGDSSPMSSYAKEGKESKPTVAGPNNLTDTLYVDPATVLTPANTSELVAEGFFGRVFRGSYRTTDVAIKEVTFDRYDAPTREVFARELALLESLQHPHIVKLLAYTLRDDRGYLIMEYARNLSLSDHLYPEVALVVPPRGEGDGGDKEAARVEREWITLRQRTKERLKQRGPLAGYLHLRLAGLVDASKPAGQRLLQRCGEGTAGKSMGAVGAALRGAAPCLVVSVGPHHRWVSLRDPEAAASVEDLEALLGELPALTWADRLRIACEAWQAVHWLHTSRENDGVAIVHHDLKTGNILLDEHLRAKVADVGLAQRLPLRASQTHVSTVTFFGGTPGYIDPRAVDKERPRKGEKNDVYSFGVVLYEMFTALPAEGTDEARAVKEAVLALSQQCTSEQWETRPGSLDVLNALQALADKHQVKIEGQR
jgi:hypothetical protein